MDYSMSWRNTNLTRLYHGAVAYDIFVSNKPSLESHKRAKTNVFIKLIFDNHQASPILTCGTQQPFHMLPTPCLLPIDYSGTPTNKYKQAHIYLDTHSIKFIPYNKRIYSLNTMGHCTTWYLNFFHVITISSTSEVAYFKSVAQITRIVLSSKRLVLFRVDEDVHLIYGH